MDLHAFSNEMITRDRSRCWRPVCLEHEQRAEWYEMSSAQAGLKISNQLGNEGLGGLGRRGGHNAVCEILHWFLAICLNPKYPTRFMDQWVLWLKRTSRPLCRNGKFRRSCCPFCNYLRSPARCWPFLYRWFKRIFISLWDMNSYL